MYTIWGVSYRQSINRQRVQSESNGTFDSENESFGVSYILDKLFQILYIVSDMANIIYESKGSIIKIADVTLQSTYVCFIVYIV